MAPTSAAIAVHYHVGAFLLAVRELRSLHAIQSLGPIDRSDFGVREDGQMRITFRGISIQRYTMRVAKVESLVKDFGKH